MTKKSSYLIEVSNAKIQDFSVTQILREIKIGEFRVSKSAIFTNSDTLNFAFYEFLHFLKDEIYQTN